MDPTTKEKIAEMICGDDTAAYPRYRSSTYLTSFFQDINLNYTHDGSTRKWWVLNVLNQLNEEELEKVILRLADPKLYSGNKDETLHALGALNSILEIEGLKILIDKITPKFIKVEPNFNFEQQSLKELEQLSSRKLDFENLRLERGLVDLLEKRWSEVQKCINSEAYLAAVILMGSILEGFLLGIFRNHPEIVNKSKRAPVDQETCKPKYFADWKLGEMIDVANDLGMITLDRQKFSHSLRDFRNLIHPYHQFALNAFPDKDTCNISWLVVQAACNDLSEWLGSRTSGSWEIDIEEDEICL